MRDEIDGESFSGGIIAGGFIAVLLFILITGAIGLPSKNDCWDASHDSKFTGYEFRIQGRVFPKCQMQIDENKWVDPYSVSVEDE